MLIRKSIVISSNAQVIYLNAIENNYLLKRIHEKRHKKFLKKLKELYCIPVKSPKRPLDKFMLSFLLALSVGIIQCFKKHYQKISEKLYA